MEKNNLSDVIRNNLRVSLAAAAILVPGAALVEGCGDGSPRTSATSVENYGTSNSTAADTESDCPVIDISDTGDC